MIPPIDLVLTDIDGTLVPEGTDEFPEKLWTLIPALAARGIRFATASGRNYSSQEKLFAPVREQMMFLCENGTVLYDGRGNLLDKSVMDRDLVAYLFEQVMACPGAEILLGAAYGSYACPKSEAFLHLVRDLKHTSVTVVRSMEEVREDICKVSALCPAGPEALNARFQKYGAPRCQTTYSADHWFDFCQRGKAEGVKSLLDRLGVDPARVMYFGDSFNDLGALRLVGHPWVRDTSAPALRDEFPNQTADVAATLEAMLRMGAAK